MATFIVETNGAGQGGLGLSIEGKLHQSNLSLPPRYIYIVILNLLDEFSNIQFIISLHEYIININTINLSGPCKAETSVIDNKDGSCTVEYLPTKAGTYDISIKFADEHIPGNYYPMIYTI